MIAPLGREIRLLLTECIVAEEEGEGYELHGYSILIAGLLAFVVGFAIQQAPTASAACTIDSDVCFLALDQSIIDAVPEQYERGLLARSSVAARLIPNDPVRTCGILLSIDSEVSALYTVGFVSATGLAGVQSAIADLLPPSPITPNCLPPSPI